MPIKIEFVPTSFANLKQTSVTISGSTIHEALQNATQKFKDIASYLLTNEGKYRDIVRFSLNGEDVRLLDNGLNQTISEGDVITVRPTPYRGAC